MSALYAVVHRPGSSRPWHVRLVFKAQGKSEHVSSHATEKAAWVARDRQAHKAIERMEAQHARAMTITTKGSAS